MRKGSFYAVIAYLAWGLLPLYWRLFDSMGSWEVLAQRIVWSFVFVGILVTLSRQWRQVWKLISNKRSLMAAVLCSIFISTNWFVFIWGVNNDHVIEVSMGYYMNPLISILLAVVVLKEKLLLGQWVSIALAAIGVAIMSVQYGHFPWVSIVLAASFSFYGFGKKVARLDVLTGLTWETIIALPASLVYLLFIQVQGTSGFISLSPLKMVLLLLSGPATALPLFWFAKATKVLPLSLLGFIQYIAPTTSLILAVSLFHEPFTSGQLVSFSFIWLALIVYTFASYRKSMNSKRELKKISS